MSSRESLVTALKIENVHKRYGSVTALAGVSFEVAAGMICGLLGPNGAGKSTLMHCVVTLLRPDAGRIFCFGVDSVVNPRAARASFGYVAQETALDKTLTGREHLELQANLYHIERMRIRTRVEEALDLVGLREAADRRIATYSGGMARRLDLACALLHEPRLLILDEPTVGLDIHTRSAVWNFIERLAERGTAVLLASHFMEEIEMLAQHIVILDHGRVLGQGTAAQLKATFGRSMAYVKVKPVSTREELEHLAMRLRGLPMAQRVFVDEAEGGRVVLALHEEPRDPESLRRVLADALNVRSDALAAFGIEQPTLNDVFLEATGRRLRDAPWSEAETHGSVGVT